MLIRHFLRKAVSSALPRRVQAVRCRLAWWSSELDQHPVLCVGKEVVRVEQAAVLRRVVGGHHHWHFPEPQRESVLATRRRSELSFSVYLTLQLLLVTDAESKVPQVIKNDAIVEVALEPSQSVRKVLKVTHRHNQRPFEERLRELSFASPGRSQNHQEGAAVKLLLGKTRQPSRDCWHFLERLEVSFRSLRCCFSFFRCVTPLLPAPHFVEVPFPRHHPVSGEVKVLVVAGVGKLLGLPKVLAPLAQHYVPTLALLRRDPHWDVVALKARLAVSFSLRPDPVCENVEEATVDRLLLPLAVKTFAQVVPCEHSGSSLQKQSFVQFCLPSL